MIVITEDAPRHALESFVIPSHYKDDLASVLIPYGMIQDRVARLAELIAQDTITSLVACCVLKGAHVFFAHLTNHLKKLKNKHGLNIPMSYEFIKVKSYENQSSVGDVRISMTHEELLEFKGKDVLICEDIVDTGKTMVALLEKLKLYAPRSVKVVSLLLKKTERSNAYVPDYVGFSIPDLFVVGYALDYNEVFRDLDHICVINEPGMAKYAV